MFAEPLIIENVKNTNAEEKALGLVKSMLDKNIPICNLREVDELNPKLGKYESKLSKEEVSYVCDLFNPLPSVYESSSRVAIFSNVSTIRYDPNKTRFYSSNVCAFAHGTGYVFHITDYPDYERALITVGHYGINTPKVMLGYVEQVGKSELFMLLCDLLIWRCSQLPSENV